MSDGMVEFVRARYGEVEAAARESHYEGQRWLTEEEGVYRWPADELVHMADRKADARHIALHDPARVLRELEAKRAILAMHVPDVNGCCSVCASTRDRWQEDWPLDEWPCQTVRHLTTEFSDHPDYRESWKP